MKTLQRHFAAGLDGGGTKTAVEVCDADGRVLATAQGGPSNFQVIGAEKASSVIVDLLETCAHSVGCRVSDFDSIVAGLSGAGRASDRERMSAAIRKEAKRRRYRIHAVVESDARIALEGAFEGAPGIIVIAGTGSIVFGKDDKGKVFRAGGWGRMLGDEGSGYTIGREAFRAVAKMMDGAGRTTKLASQFSRTFGLDSQEKIIAAVYRNGFDIASAAPLVIKAASAGDRVALDIVEGAVTEVVGVVSAVVRKMSGRKGGRTKIPLAFIGSVLSNDSVYPRKVRSALRRSLPRVKVVRPTAGPVHGASLMALSVLRSSL